MSYLFDLYRGEELDPTFVEFALYMVFFPVTISGPICRMPDMLPQFRSDQRSAWTLSERGLSPNRDGCSHDATGDDCWGRESSPVTASTAASTARPIGAAPMSGVSRSGTDCSSSSISRDTHMSRSVLPWLLGFTLPENFARPFQSTTPSIFWTRWHMSLSFWIRDYVFLPLATCAAKSGGEPVARGLHGRSSDCGTRRRCCS